MHPPPAPQFGTVYSTLQPNQFWQAKHRFAFFFLSLSLSLYSVSLFLSLSLTAIVFPPINLHIRLFSLCFYSFVFLYFFSHTKKKKTKKWTCIAWLINAGSFIAQKKEKKRKENAEPCAPPVFVQGYLQEPRLWNSYYYYWAGPLFTVGRWRLKNKQTTTTTTMHDYCRMSQNRERGRERIWFHKIACCISESHGTLTFVSMLLVCFFFVCVIVDVFFILIFFFLKPTAHMAKLHSSTGSPHEKLSRECVFFKTEVCVCVCVCVCFSWDPPTPPHPSRPSCVAVYKQSASHFSNLDKTTTTEAIRSTTSDFWYQATHEICIACLKLDGFFFFFFVFVVWILHWWLLLKKLAFLFFSFFFLHVNIFKIFFWMEKNEQTQQNTIV